MPNNVAEVIQRLLCQSWCDGIDIAPDGDALRLCMPFLESDGDHVTVWLTEKADGWRLEDGGTTLMRASYYLDASNLVPGPRRSMLDKMLAEFGAHLADDGQIIAQSDETGLGTALLRYGHALLRVSDLRSLMSNESESIESTHTRLGAVKTLRQRMHVA